MHLSDQTKEQIKFNTEIIKLIFVLFLTTGGGVITLVINEIDTGAEIFFTAGGMIIAVIVLYSRYTLTQKLIDSGKS